MISNIEFDLWCLRLNLSEEAKALINQIRSSGPSRKVSSSRGNVVGRFPSRKMGSTIQFESHKVELAFIHEYEHDKVNTLEYYDQPFPIKLIYESSSGRRLGVWHTSDFFVIRPFEAGWEECKTEEQLITLSAKNPNRYFLDEEGKWRCPSGEAYAEKFGLYYRVRSSQEINWTYQRNIEFLDDYYRLESAIIKQEVRTYLLDQVTKESGITLGELFKQTQGKASRDDVFMLIASDELYVNLRAVPLVESGSVRVYPNYDTAIAYGNLLQVAAQVSANIQKIINVAIGNSVQWDGKGWTIVNLGETSVGLIGENNAFVELPIVAFEKLVQESRITGLPVDGPPSIYPEALRRFMQANKSAYEKANYRFQIVRSFMRGDPLHTEKQISERTLRYWAAQCRHAEEAYGNAYVGLLPAKRKGNAGDKLPLTTRTLLDEFIKKDYMTIKQKRKYEVFADYKLVCEQQGVPYASYKTFCKAVKRHSQYELTKTRQGPRASYKHKEFYLELDLTTPRHGERPFHIAHLDHTEEDVELRCSLTGKNLGRAWATFLTDAYSRRLLAVYLTYDPPSYRSCMMIMRICVQRYGRLPQIVVVDGGLEFSSTYFETFLAMYECTKKTRPPAKSRFSSVSERLFGTSHSQFTHNLQGNTQIMRNVRQVTKSINPKEHALWTLEKEYIYLCKWAYEVYDTNEHPALGQSPRDAFVSGMIATGERKHLLIPYDNDFRMLTLPTTPKGTAKVFPGRGVKIKNRYFWSDTFRDPRVEGTQVPVRFDPFNAGVSYVYALDHWSECYSEYYKIFRDRTEREIMLATAELRRRQTLHSRQFNITATKLAQFLESVEAEEVLLRQQMADREMRNVLTLIDGGMKSLGAETTNPNKQSSQQPELDECHKIAPPELYGEF
jgi:transposase InsO family protein